MFTGLFCPDEGKFLISLNVSRYGGAEVVGMEN